VGTYVRAIVTIVVLICGSACTQISHVPQEGGRAPEFAITTDGGSRISTTAFGGKLLVLNFWETSCVPCVKELPSLGSFARKFRSEGVVVVAVGADDDAEKYRRFLRDHRVALETYRDPARRISTSFGTDMFPETYLIQDGRIIRKVVGGVDWMNEEMAAFVHARLADQDRPDARKRAQQ
jgi:peroxiredoxin